MRLMNNSAFTSSSVFFFKKEKRRKRKEREKKEERKKEIKKNYIFQSSYLIPIHQFPATEGMRETYISISSISVLEHSVAQSCLTLLPHGLYPTRFCGILQARIL